MGAGNRPPDRDDVYDTPDDVYETYGDDDESQIPYFPVPFGWTPALPWGSEPEDRPTEPTGYDAEPDDDTWLDEGVVGLLLVVGVVLFVVPEPATSGLGLALIGVGLFLGVLDWLAPDD